VFITYANFRVLYKEFIIYVIYVKCNAGIELSDELVFIRHMRPLTAICSYEA
jgi:hypothetical protein